jgi:hypothetical protein
MMDLLCESRVPLDGGRCTSTLPRTTRMMSRDGDEDEGAARFQQARYPRNEIFGKGDPFEDGF